MPHASFHGTGRRATKLGLLLMPFQFHGDGSAGGDNEERPSMGGGLGPGLLPALLPGESGLGLGLMLFDPKPRWWSRSVLRMAMVAGKLAVAVAVADAAEDWSP
jgi:hypothetical protein